MTEREVRLRCLDAASRLHASRIWTAEEVIRTARRFEQWVDALTAAARKDDDEDDS